MRPKDMVVWQGGVSELRCRSGGGVVMRSGTNVGAMDDVVELARGLAIIAAVTVGDWAKFGRGGFKRKVVRLEIGNFAGWERER